MKDGRALSIERGRQRALLGFLLLRANEVVAQDRLVDALWGESPPATAVTALHGHVSRLRRLVGADRLETRPPGYLLRVAPDELDLGRFRELLAQERYDEALALWRGPPLADLAFADFAQSEIARLEELRLSALEGRSSASSPTAGTPSSPGSSRRPSARTRCASALRSADARAVSPGRQADALAAYQRRAPTLVEELGLEPGEELSELQRQILAHDPALDRPRAGRGTELPASLTSFVGRGRELEQVRALLVRPGVRLLTLTGAGGVGKTRLALEVARAAAGEFADGARFVPLARRGGAGPRAPRDRRGARLHQSSGQSIEDTLKAFLADRELLLVLDNLEHLLDATPLATELLAAAPALDDPRDQPDPSQPLRRDEYAVPPLSAREEAVTLFADRAAAVRPDFAGDRRRGGDLRAARRAAARDRARRGAHPDARARGDPRPPRAAAGAADGRPA